MLSRSAMRVAQEVRRASLPLPVDVGQVRSVAAGAAAGPLGSPALAGAPAADKREVDVSFRCTASVALADRATYHHSDAPEFVATLLAPLGRGASPVAPRCGRRVVVSLCADGLVLREETEQDGIRRYTPGCFSAFTPMTFVEPVMLDLSGKQDPTALRIAGLHPTWAVSLRLGSDVAAKTLMQEVNKLCLRLVSWMHKMHVAEVGPRDVEEPLFAPVPGARGDRADKLVYGAYIISMKQHGFQNAGSEPVKEPLARCLWLEIRGPVEEGATGTALLMMRFFTSHKPDADVVFTDVKDVRDGVALEVVDNVLFTTKRACRKAESGGHEAPPTLIIACRSPVEASLLSNLVSAAFHQDPGGLEEDVKDALRGCCVDTHCEVGDNEPSCWVKEVLDLRRQEVAEVPEHLKRLREERKRELEQERGRIVAALAKQFEEEEEWFKSQAGRQAEEDDDCNTVCYQ